MAVRIVYEPKSPESSLNPYVAAIRAEARRYAAYYHWDGGYPLEREFYLLMARKNWEMYAAIYRVQRRKVLHIA